MFALFSEAYLSTLMRGLTLPKVEIARPANSNSKTSRLRAVLRRLAA